MNRNESDLDKLLKKFIIDAIKIIFSRDIRGIDNKFSLLSVLAYENKAGFIGATIFCSVLLCLVIITINEYLL